MQVYFKVEISDHRVVDGVPYLAMVIKHFQTLEGAEAFVKLVNDNPEKYGLEGKHVSNVRKIQVEGA